jgi:alcohol dehydrogenase
MMAAAAMGAVAFQKGLGGIHALSHPISVRFGTHHGTTNAVLMPYVLAANRFEATAAIERLARYTGIDGGFDGFLDHVLSLRRSSGVPNTLVELGVDPAVRDAVAADAVKEPTAAGNPRSFTVDLAAEIFDAACSGSIGDLTGDHP